MHWLSSLPEKYCEQIMQKVKEMSAADSGKETKQNYRVILSVNDEPRQNPRRTGHANKSQSSQLDNSVTFAVTRLDQGQQAGTKLLPVAVPKPQEPIFRSHPQLYSRE